MSMKSRSQTKKGPGRIPSKVKERRSDKVFASDNGVPETLRRYAARFGADVFSVVQTQRKADALIEFMARKVPA